MKRVTDATAALRTPLSAQVQSVVLSNAHHMTAVAAEAFPH